MTSRRAVLSAGLAAIPVGIGTAFGIRHVMATGTILRILGRDATMLALFDTGNERVLFLLGDPDVGTLGHLAQLLPIGRRRLDIIVGSHQWLTSEGARDHLDLETITTLSLQATASTPPIRGNVYPVTSSLQFELGKNSSVSLSVGRAHEAAGTNPDFVAEIRLGETRLVLARGATALHGIEAGPHLLAVPGEIDPESITIIQPGILVCTSSTAEMDVPAVQAFPDDAVVFTIRDGSVSIREDQFFS